MINSGGEASALVTELVRATGFPVTLTLMGLGAYPASDPQFIGMLGMHGTYEANLAMHGCDLMIAIGARFDDRVTGRLDKFSPGSKKIQVDIDPSSINKNVPVDVAVVGDAGRALRALLEAWRAKGNLGRPGRGSSPGGSRSRAGRRRTACATARTARSSSRNTRSSGCTS